MKWDGLAPGSCRSAAEALTTVTIALSRSGAPESAVLRPVRLGVQPRHP
jgi:hypothetical protein